MTHLTLGLLLLLEMIVGLGFFVVLYLVLCNDDDA
jgi:hypothetical protein